MTDPKKVCVTGGSGFLAAWIVKKLLEKGYIVHATTRRREKALFLESFTQHSKPTSTLFTTKDAGSNLKIFDGCDFDTKDSFDRAIDGCQSVIHCASPFFNVGGTRENLVTPAIDGTESVLRACSKFHVKQVTLTSSVAAVMADFGEKAAASSTGNHVYTEEDWSPADLLETRESWYALSKTLAERRAWELAREPECTFQMCVLNPGLIWGPLTPGQNHLNTSTQAIVQYMDGTHQKIQNGYRGVVDVRDVAEAHIVPIEKNVGWGNRYLLLGGAPHFSETARCVREALEQSTHPDMAANVPTDLDDMLAPTMMGPPADKPLLYDVSKTIADLGIDFFSVEDMITPCVDEALANGFLRSDEKTPNLDL